MTDRETIDDYCERLAAQAGEDEPDEWEMRELDRIDDAERQWEMRTRR